MASAPSHDLTTAPCEQTAPPPAPSSLPSPPSDPISVTYVFWPAEADRRAELAAGGRCRLLLLSADTPAPEMWDPLEDWIREPFEAGDLEARALAVEARARRRTKPFVDSDGVLHLHDRHVTLSDPQRALVEALLVRFGELVPLADLQRAHERAGAVASVDTTTRALQRCRTKLRGVGLELHTVRAKGFLLTMAPSDT